VNGDPATLPIVAGDPPVQIERGHEGWNWVDCQFTLTANQPAYFSAFTGLPTFSTDFPGSPPARDPMCQPFDTLDPGNPPGRPDPDNPRNGRVLRGFAFAFAVAADDDSVNRQIRWNNLSGSAVLINYARSTAAEYSAYAFSALGGQPCGDDVQGCRDCCDACAGNGEEIGTPGILNMDGLEYSSGPDKLLFDFYATGSTALSGQFARVDAETDITLHPISQDVRQDGNGRVTSKAVFDIWNQNEVRFSGTEKCISCWDQTIVSRYPAPNHMLRQNLQTDKGKARIDGKASAICVSPAVATVPPVPADPSEDASLLGITIKQLTFITPDGQKGVNTQFATGALNMTTQGEQSGQIRYDLVDALQIGNNGIEGAAGVDGNSGVGNVVKTRPATRGGR